MICVLTLYSDGAIDITTKDGRVFQLLHSPASVSSKTSARTSLSTPHSKASRQCIWCDKFGHNYSEYQEFHEAIRHGYIYLNEINRIISTRTGKQLPLAIGGCGMKAYL